MNRTQIVHIAEQLGVPDSFVVELCEAGIVTVEGELIPEQIVERIRVSWTLHDELGVNLAGVEVALHLLSVIERDRRTLVDEP
ncbi:MAG TPA: hypothetical protein ENK18_24050 [Deltaproteobacteria bacterium]|nr:hypothetical protein [Deltaproteobacteria bacterium]